MYFTRRFRVRKFKKKIVVIDMKSKGCTADCTAVQSSYIVFASHCCVCPFHRHQLCC